MNTKDSLIIALVVIAVLVAVWDGVWKLIALWKSARREQLAWFICLAVFNTAGILPILYLTLFQKVKTPASPPQMPQ
ncbi:MAG TPA: DUF5652 family protein [Verrucomicrobiae bacterium]|nr:DUF5652 family protein [Verrucomicrobiae bacterium]